MLATSQIETGLQSPVLSSHATSQISTTKESPKASQTLVTTGQGISSSQSSSASVASSVTVPSVPQSQPFSAESPTHTTSSSQTDALKRAHSYLEENGDEDPKELVELLVKALNKSKAETNQHKIQAQLLSMSAKDADMRYQVENDLVKTEVQKLKTQNDQVEYLMGKVTGQKQLIKKYRNEILNKNKEIIRLKTKINDYAHSGKKRRKSSASPTGTENGMLDTLGMLASQVLTEEEHSEPPKASFRRG